MSSAARYLSGRFECIEIEPDTFGGPLTIPLWALGAVDGDFVVADEIDPVFCVHLKAWVRFDVCRHDDEAQFKQFNAPVPELAGFSVFYGCGRFAASWLRQGAVSGGNASVPR